MARKGDREVALIVERHGVDLAERILAVEHPAVGARKQGVGDVADALDLEARGRVAGPVPWTHCRRRSCGNLPSLRTARTRLLHRERGARDDGGRIEKADPPTVAEARGAPLDALAHDPLALAVEPRQGLQGVERLRGQYVRVVLTNAFTKQQVA